MVAELTTRLQSGNAEERMETAEEISDIFEYGNSRLDDVERIVSTLIEAAVAETDEYTRETMLDALSNAEIRYGPIAGPWEKLARAMSSFDAKSLDLALTVLSFTYNPAFRVSILPYLNHGAATVRESARYALAELGVLPKELIDRAVATCQGVLTHRKP